MAGGTIGYLKNNDKFQDFLFGEMKNDDPNSRDGGLISKSFRDAVKKAAPRMLVGQLVQPYLVLLASWAM